MLCTCRICSRMRPHRMPPPALCTCVYHADTPPQPALNTCAYTGGVSAAVTVTQGPSEAGGAGRQRSQVGGLGQCQGGSPPRAPGGGQTIRALLNHYGIIGPLDNSGIIGPCTVFQCTSRGLEHQGWCPQRNCSANHAAPRLGACCTTTLRLFWVAWWYAFTQGAHVCRGNG